VHRLVHDRLGEFLVGPLSRVLTSALAAACLTAGLQASASAAPVPAAPAAPAAAPAPPPAESYERPDTYSAQLAARLLGRRVEVTGLRSETETVWANPDGTFTSDVTSGPTRVRKNGAWVPLDLSLEQVGGRLRPVAAPADVSFSGGGNGPLTLQSHQGRSLALGWKGALPAPDVDGGVATYRDVLPGADLELATSSFGFSERLNLRSRPAKAPVVRFPVTGKGLALAKGRNGDLLVTDAKGAVVAHAPAPRMWDASVDPRSGEHTRSVPIPTEIVRTATGSELVLSPPASFLDDPAVEYPVTVDPSISVSNLGDTWVQNDYTTSQISDPWLKVGTYDGGTHVARSLIKWSLGTASGKHVLSATMSLYEHWSYSCTASSMSMGPVNAAFSSSTVWSNQPTYTGTYGATTSFAKGYSSSCPDGRQSLNILSMVDAWADGALTNNGLKLWGSNEGDSNSWKKFCSANVSSSSADAPCTTSSNVPTLSITYNTVPNAPTNLSPANNAYTNDTTPTLSGKVTDPDGGSLHGVFYAQDVSAGNVWIINGSSGNTVSSGGTSGYTRASALVNGRTYHWRMKANDGTDNSAYVPSSTTWYTFTVDTTAPVTPTVSSTTYQSGQWGGGAGTAGTFTFGNGGSTDVVGYYYGLDDSTPGTYTTATSASVTPSTEGPHHVYVQSKDRAGNVSPVKDYAFNVGAGAVTSPAGGDRTQKRFTLKAAGQPSFTSVKFQYRRADADAWTDIAASALTDTSGNALSSNSMAMASSASTPAVWDVTATLAATDPDGPVQVRAVFAPAGTASAPVALTLDRTAYGDYATDDVGPGSVNLVTGNLTISASDVSVSSYGSDLTVSRTYQSRDPGAGADGMFGAPWTSSAEVGAAGSDFGSLVVAGNLVTVSTSDGDTVAFAKRTDGTYAAELGAEELTLTYASATDTYTLADLDGDTTTFAVTPLTTTTAATTTSNSVPVADASKVAVDQRIDLKNGVTLVAGNRKVTAISGATVTFDGAAVSVPSGAKVAAASTYLPSQVAQPGSGNMTSYSYDAVAGGGTRVARILAPKPTGVTCPAYPATLLTSTAKGCRAVELHYATTTTATGTTESAWGDYAGRVSSIGFVAWDPDAATPAMTEFTVARYAYDSNGRLRAAWDPRLSTPLKTVYDYDSAGHVTSVTPPSERTTPAPLASWGITYSAITGDANTGRLATVSRTSATTGEARTTVVYAVPITGSGAPYDLGATERARWAQSDAPTDATAVFDTTTACGVSVATTTPVDYGCASVHYTDANGREVNTASPSGGGISTTEYDGYGNVVRSLSAENRARALDDSDTDVAATEAALSRTLDEQQIYAADGQRLLETYGPAHQVELASDGRTVVARAHTVNTYDEGAPAGTRYDLVTTAATGAREVGTTTDVDVRVTKTAYDWNLRQATAVTSDAVTGGLNIVTRTAYDSATGLATSTTRPAGGTTTNTAQTTLTVYYSAAANATYPACGGHAEWANLPCQSRPAAQPGTTDMPDLPVVTLTYTAFNMPRTKTETVGATTRTTTTSYDAAGRPATVTVTGGIGTGVSATATSYSTSTGQVDAVCETSCAPGNARIDRTYDDFGRETSYTDAGGVTSTTTYDVASRTVATYDGKETQTRTYDQGTERRGLVTQLVDTQAGTFTATYGIDGDVATETYPNGIVATTTQDEAGTPVQVTYDQPGCPLADCVWLTDSVVESVHGQVASHSGLSAQSYGYDRAGRLTGVDDVSEGVCTRRAYTLDANSNRTQVLETAFTDDTCTTSAGSASVTSYVDAADRLYAVSPRTASNANDYGYDAFGRTTRVPAAHAGVALTAIYYTDDLVRSVTSGGTTRTWSRDPASRLSGWTDGDPASGMTHVNHFDGDGDTPSWTTEAADGSAWTRVVNGIAALALVHATTAGATVELQLTNLHGDVAVVASSTATEPPTPLASFDATEFGTPRGGLGTGPRYGWLGGRTRSADVPGGLLLMGVRLYLPSTGRFLQVDPVAGGNATAYDYVHHDPVNGYDLDGRWGFKCKWCKNALRRAANVTNFAGSIVALGTYVGCAACAAVGYGMQLASAAMYGLSGDWKAAGRVAFAATFSFAVGKVNKVIKGFKTVGRAARAGRALQRFGNSAGAFYMNRHLCGWGMGCSSYKKKPRIMAPGRYRMARMDRD
jgi:RHS repeat-associated protein